MLKEMYFEENSAERKINAVITEKKYNPAITLAHHVVIGLICAKQC
jgi:hypothetical protein